MISVVSDFIKDKHHICVVQAENPDGDSLGAALALEEALSEKDISLYCPVDIPKYLRYFEGWSRVDIEFSYKADAYIIVDTASSTLISKLLDDAAIRNCLYSSRVLVIDHHETAPDLDFDHEEIIEQIASQYYKKPDNFSISKITEIKNLPSINTKKLEKICYPLDKVNSTLWYGFPVGKMKKLKAESDKDAKKGKQASILLLLNFDELDGVRISRTLTIYDKCVWNGIANLKKEGHNVVTTAQIYEAMGNTSKLNARDKKKILESVKVISRARVTIDNTEEAKLYKYDKVAFDTPLLAAEICTAYANGNIVDDAIRIIEMPKLFLFAENRAQITQLPLQVLDSPISKTDDNLLLTDYLITRIARMKNSKYITRTILLDTIHQKCNVKTSKQKQRLPEKIERILKHYKNIGWIKDFKLTNREIEIFTF